VLEKLFAGETENDIMVAHPHVTKENIKAALAFAAQSLKGQNILHAPFLFPSDLL